MLLKDITDLDRTAVLEEVTQLCDQIAKLLGGRHPAIQGAVLADLLAMWLAGHPSELRLEMVAQHIKTAVELVAPNEAKFAEEIERIRRRAKNPRSGAH